MPTTTTWHATVRTDHGPFNEATAEAIAEGLPGFSILQHDGDTNTLTVRFDVEAPTLRAATDEALRAVREVGAGRPVAVDVKPLADRIRELEHPAAQELIGLAEIAEILGVSKQRAKELADTYPDFPAPIARPAMGPIYLRPSVVAFEQRWPRKRTGRPRRTA